LNYNQSALKIFLLRGDLYAQSQTSAIFADLPVVEMIPQLLQDAQKQDSSRVLRELRARLAEGRFP
jgi:hypothetical protein